MNIKVLKRDGSREDLDLSRFHKVTAMACEGIPGVSASEVEIKSQIQFYTGISTKDIQETLIKSAGNLISEENPNYQYVAARLVNYHLRKEVYGKYEPDKLYAHYQKVRDLGFYDKEIGESFSDEEWAELNKWIDHNRDELLSYIAMEQFRGKYLVRNRDTKTFLETPQITFMMIAITLFMRDDKDKRMQLIKDFYDAISTFDISLPSPIMAGVRTPERQFSSCVVIDVDDNLDSIIASAGAVVKYTSKRAGIGLGGTKLRALGDAVRNGQVTHTGTIPFIKHLQTAVNSVSQGGLRKASATLNLLFWHLEIEDHLVLKNNKGTEESRVRGLDYNIHLNKVMYERLLSGGNITLFSPKDHPEMYKAYYTNVSKFRELYEKAERSRCRKKIVKASDLFQLLMTERKETARIYISNVDHVNDHSAYNKDICPVVMSNLCQEISLYTKPLKSLDDKDAEIGLCTLAALNFGKIKTLKDLEKPSKLVVRALDNLLSYQDYLMPAAANCGVKRRSLGIGFTNFAYWMAKNDIKFSNPNLSKIHELAEAYSYYIIKASADLAVERGHCEQSIESIYHTGGLPIHSYKKEVDELTPNNLLMPWDALREQLLETGIRNYPLLAEMPVETSAATSNSTNGINPIPAIVTIKGSKDLMTAQVGPESKKLKHKYELKWDMPSPSGFLKICAVFQKFMDQAISVNTVYNPENYPNEEIPMSVMIKDLIDFYKYGGKNLYYYETFDGAGEIEVKDEEACDSCTV